MSKKSIINNLSLQSYDDIFNTDEEREDNSREKVMDIALSELFPFANHPFKVCDDEAMTELVESIKVNGMLNPGIARPRIDGGYELLSGHRRKRACELAGMDSMKVIVRELDDDEAIIVMADSNLLNRGTLLYSEKAYAYKMKLEALKRQLGRPSKEDGSQAGSYLKGKKSYELLGEKTGDSRNQVFRYIGLTELIDKLMNMVDERKIGFCPAVELSYLTAKEQALLVNVIQKEEATPSLSQAQRIKEYSQKGTLTEAIIEMIMHEEKKETVKVTITNKRLKKYFPDTFTPHQMKEVIFQLLEGWYQQKQEKEVHSQTKPK